MTVHDIIHNVDTQLLAILTTMATFIEHTGAPLVYAACARRNVLLYNLVQCRLHRLI